MDHLYGNTSAPVPIPLPIPPLPTSTTNPTTSANVVFEREHQRPVVIQNSADSCITCRIHLPPHEQPLPPQPPPTVAAAAPVDSFRPPLTDNQNFINTNPNGGDTTMSVYNSRSTRTFSMSDHERQIIIKRNPSDTPFGENSTFPANENNVNLPVVVIKQEPREWPVEEPVQVKQEIVYNEETETEGGCSGGEDVPMYTPLTCELCNEIFTVPGEWVRHIENHAETPQTVPKKRRRTGEVRDINL